MTPMRVAVMMVACAWSSAMPGAQEHRGAAVALTLAALDGHGVVATTATHEGRPAIRLLEADDSRAGGLALVREVSFLDGELTIDVAGRRGQYAVPDDRGFVGLAFRVSPDRSRYEYIYLRPDNGRAESQEQRNHATQYASHPDFPWPVLRKQFPSRYESYVDLVSGAWTTMRIVVEGPRARLFVGDAPQPVLVVNDMKLPPARGGVALWIGAGSEAFFSNLRVTR